MSDNGLGWLGIRAIIDMDRVRSLLNNAGVRIIVPIYPQPAAAGIWEAAAANEINGHMTNVTWTLVNNEENIANGLTRPSINESPLLSRLSQRNQYLNGGLYLNGGFQTQREDAVYVRSLPGFPSLSQRAVFELTQPVVGGQASS